MQKAKVLMVHNFYQIGGGEHTVFENEKTLLLENGHEVIEYTRNNFDINSIKEKIMLPINMIFNIKTYKEIKKIIRNEKIDVMHCHNTFPLISPSAYYAAKKLGVPVIQTVHNFRFLCPSGLLYRNGEICEKCCEKGLFQGVKNRCYRNSRIGSTLLATMLNIHRKINTFNKKVDKYIVLTEFNKNKLSQIIDDNKMVVKSNFSFIKENKEEEIKEKKYFIFIGRFTEEKGIRFLLECWKEINDEKLIIIGDGPLKHEVEEISCKYNNIEYLGFLKHEDILEKLNNSKAIIFTGECYEGAFPLVLIEAMSQGVAMVVPNIGNVNDVVYNSDFGLVYNSSDKSNFIKTVREMCNQDVNNSMGINAKKYFNSKYTSKYNYTLLNNIYNEVILNGNKKKY